MSTDELAYGEQLTAPRRRGPAYGDAGPAPEVEARKEPAGPLDRRTEAALGLAIVTSVVGAYGATAYGLYVILSSVL
jgi:hypothetical protein